MNRVFMSALALALAGAAFSQVAVFNATPNYGWWSGDGAANRDGQIFGLSQANASLGGFDIDMLSGAGGSGTTVYTDIQLQVTFFTGFQMTFTNSGPEFTTPVYSQTFDLGGSTLNNSSGYALTGAGGAFHLTTPLAVSGSNIGAQFCWLADYGNGLVAATTLQTGKLISLATGPSVGSNPFQYPNLAWTDSGATTSSTSILQSSYRYGGANYAYVDDAVTLYTAAVPEPASIAVLGIGALALIRRRRNRKA